LITFIEERFTSLREAIVSMKHQANLHYSMTSVQRSNLLTTSTFFSKADYDLFSISALSMLA
jgi:hypothetical protein